MKTMLSKAALCFVCLAAAGLNADGSPLKRADVAADPAWVLHLDCDALRPTTVGQYIQSEMNKPEAQAKLAVFQSLVSFDLRTQLHGLTLYGASDSPKDGVLLIYADFDAERLVNLAKAANDSQSANYKQHVIYNWIDDHRKAKDGVKPRVYAAIAGNRIVFGQRQEGVSRALDVLDGAVASMASAGAAPLLGAAGDAGFLQAGIRKVEVGGSDPHAAILRLSKLAQFNLGEAQGRVKATLRLVANDEQVATNISSIAQGLLALMKLQQEKPEALKVAEALTLKQDGASVIANLALPAQDVVEMMKAGAARKAAKKAEKE